MTLTEKIELYSITLVKGAGWTVSITLLNPGVPQLLDVFIFPLWPDAIAHQIAAVGIPCPLCIAVISNCIPGSGLQQWQ